MGRVVIFWVSVSSGILLFFKFLGSQQVHVFTYYPDPITSKMCSGKRVTRIFGYLTESSLAFRSFGVHFLDINFYPTKNPDYHKVSCVCTSIWQEWKNKRKKVTFHFELFSLIKCVNSFESYFWARNVVLIFLKLRRLFLWW